MALKSTIFKAQIHVADMGRNHFGTHALTIARHPSENDERMMIRILAFALFADEALEFGKGLSAADEPDLWRKDLTGAVEQWIEVGLPDPRVVRKAAGRAAQVVVLAYGGRAASLWWQQNAGELERIDRLGVLDIAPDAVSALARMARRSMELQCTIQDGHVWFSDTDTAVEIVPTILRPYSAGA